MIDILLFWSVIEYKTNFKVMSIFSMALIVFKGKMCIHLCISANTQDEHTNIYVNAQP